MLVVNADAPILTSVLPRSVVPISRSRLASNRLTRAARRSPFFSKPCMRAREAAVSAVSEAAKNADRATNKRMVATASQTSEGGIAAPAPCMILTSHTQFILEEGEDLAGFDIFGDKAIADGSRKDKGEGATRDLFVLIHGIENLFGARVQARNIGQANRQANVLQMRFDPCLVLRAAKPAAHRETERTSHTNRDGLAMHKPCPIIGGDAFECMAEGMAEVEERPVALLIFIPRDNCRLRLAACRNRLNALGPAFANLAPMRFQPSTKTHVVDEAIFDNFGIAGAELPRRQCVERGGIGKNKQRLMGGGDQILVE